MEPLRAISLFSGIEGLGLGLEQAGIRVVAQVEIDRDCQGVLARHHPDVPRWADIQELDPHELPAADLVCGGFPCQDLSVAGRRQGLAGERSSLWWEFWRVLAAVRPRWVIVENVPGLLSAVCPDPDAAEPRPSRDHVGADFQLVAEEPDETADRGPGACPGGCMAAHGGAMGLVLGSLAELGYGFAYRVLDAQHFGLAQRRRRVFIVGYLGDWAAPVQVLLEPEGGERDPAPSRAAGAGVAASLTAGAASSRGVNDGGRRAEDDVNLVVAHSESGQGWWRDGIGPLRAEGENRPSRPSTLVSHTLRPDPGAGQAHNTDLVAYNVHAAESTAKERHAYETETARSLDTTGGFASSQGGTVVAAQCHGNNVGPMGTLKGDGSLTSGVPFVARALTSPDQPRYDGDSETFVVGTLMAGSPTSYRTGPDEAAAGHLVVDALTSSDGGADDNDARANHLVAHALTSEGHDASEDGTGRGTPIIAYRKATKAHDGQDDPERWEEDHLAATLDAAGHAPRTATAILTSTVRRLTPVECERLQGFPDGWTEFDANGKRLADSVRYRLLGNAVPVPVSRWIGQRIVRQETGSL
jgi:DNA (cytosine-5)-methyltransferase 1